MKKLSIIFVCMSVFFIAQAQATIFSGGDMRDPVNWSAGLPVDGLAAANPADGQALIDQVAISAKNSIAPPFDPELCLEMYNNPENFTDIQISTMADQVWNAQTEYGSLPWQMAWNVLESTIMTISPTPSTQLDTVSTSSGKLSAAMIRWENNWLHEIPPNEVTKHRTAEGSYGIIPDDAPRVTDTVTINGNINRRHPVGLYAVAGEVVTITVPEVLVNSDYKIRINNHSDDISNKREIWMRMPQVHRAFPITNSTMQVASAFGGVILIDLIGGARDPNPLSYGDLDITISNAVRHPWFELGRHTNEEWNSTLRHQPGTYAALASPNSLFVIPSHQVESVNLTDPERLMTWWNRMLELQDDLTGRLYPRTAKGFTNVDIQIGAGTGHSGYPVQAFESWWDNLADIDKLEVKGSWGTFHEFGHNNTRGWWTFPPDVEVSVNIFSTYCMEKMATNPSSWSWTVYPVETIKKAIAATASAAEYEGMNDRLAFWVQLAQGFGWDKIKEVFHGYELDNANNRENLPGNTLEEEAEQWCIRFSNVAGYDISGFMINSWKLPVGTDVAAQLSDLPDWMPLVGNMPDALIAGNRPHLLDYSEHIYSMDGVANIINISEPVNGTLTDNGDRTWTYEPDNNYVGIETFEYTLQSSAGNTRVFTHQLTVEAVAPHVGAMFNYSAPDAGDSVLTTAANLDLGTRRGAYWSDISMTGANAGRQLAVSAYSDTPQDRYLLISSGGNDATFEAAAVFNLPAAIPVQGATLSFDAVLINAGAQLGYNTVTGVADDGKELFEFIMSNGISTYGQRAFGYMDSTGTYQQLGDASAMPSLGTDSSGNASFVFTLHEGSFDLEVSNTVSNAGTYTGLSYNSPGPGTNLAKIIFSSHMNKASVIYDNIVVIPNDYTLTYTAGTNGSIEGNTSQTVNNGTDGTAVTAVPDPGYHFVKWSDGSTDNPRTDTGVTAYISIEAEFAMYGDIDGSNDVDLGDAIVGLKVLADVSIQTDLNMGADVNGDLTIGLEEVLYVLREEAGLR